MFSLALDTSSENFSVALITSPTSDSPVILAETTQGEAKRHLVDIFSAIDKILKNHRLSPRQIGHIAVTTGPGSFTGVRLGVLVARTFSQVHGCLLSEIQAHDALALAVARSQPPQATGAPLVLALDVRKGQILSGTVEFAVRANGTLRPHWPGGLRLLDAQEWKAQLPAETVLFGNASVRYRPQVANAWLDDEYGVVRASNVGLLGLDAKAEGSSTAWHQLFPSYVRPPDAVPLDQQASKR